MAADLLVGVDLGGTKIYTALADGSGQVLAEIKTPTEAALGAEHVIGRILGTVSQTLTQAGRTGQALRGVAVASPGPLSAREGVVHFAPNLGWREIPLRKILAERLQTDVFIDNDANLAALGEHVYGAGRGVAHMVYFTVSTGVGGGLILDNRLYHGVGDGAGELGHMQLLPDGPLCNCGVHGCLEALASGTAMAREARQLIAAGQGREILKQAGGDVQSVSAVTIAAAAGGGDPEAAGIIAQAATYLGIGVASVINILNPELIVLGGGIMEIGEPVWREVHREVKTRALSASAQQVRLVPAQLGGRAGVMGALALLRSEK